MFGNFFLSHNLKNERFQLVRGTHLLADGAVRHFGMGVVATIVEKETG